MATYPDHAIEPGTAAPAFELKATPDQSVALADFSGRPLILAFYPADWSPVCSDQMALYNELLPEFGGSEPSSSASPSTAPGATLAFAKDRNLHFPLLADFEPKGEIARAIRRLPRRARYQRVERSSSSTAKG